MSEQSAPERERLKNIHLEVSESFHHRLKLLCVVRKTSLKAYGLEALKEKVARDDAEIAGRGAK